ncbi:MAG: MATE family efflux transporter [Synergistaceae bacterium]|jgi:putative MATE family efflux protein|nr:MATE family efflux transporter [Synergistaceae bacterium]
MKAIEAAKEGKNTHTQNKMGTAPVGRMLLTMSLPLMLSMLFEAFYNVVDSLFVAYVSEKALTAVSLAFPIQLLVVSVTVGTGVGINACLSRMLGENNQKGVDSAAMNGVFLALLTYVVFLIFGIFFSKVYFTSQTSDAEICQYGIDYLSVCMIYSFGAVGQIAFQRILQSTGRTVLSMVSQLVGAVINIAFDPILIFGYFGFPAMGTRGAAIATVSGQIVAFVIAVYFNFAKNKDVNFRVKGYRPDLRMIGEIYRVGVPAIVNQSLNSLMAFGVNFILIKISATAVAAFGIYIKVQNFIFMPTFGVGNGAIAIIAFNYGARQKKRIDAAIKFGSIYACCIMLLGTLLIQIFANQILALFDASADLMSAGVPALRIISSSFIFAALTLIMQSAYQGLANGVYSLIITLMRVVVVLLPALYIFARIFDLKHVWWAFVLAEGFSALVGAFLLKRIYFQKVAPLDRAMDV